MPAPPPCYFELSNTVEEYITKNSKLRGWEIDAAEDLTAGKVEAFPYAKDGTVGFRAGYENSDLGVKARIDWSSACTSWRSYLPTLAYTKKVNDVSHTVEFETPVMKANYTLTHPAFFVTWGGDLRDGGAGRTTFTTRLMESVFAGAAVDYDPKRSGINNLVAIASRRDCSAFNGGDIVGKYSLSNGFGLHVRAPVHPFVDVGVIAEKNRFIAGVQGRSPCGARMIVNTNVSEGSLTFAAIRNIQDIWKVSVTYTLPLIHNASASAAPRFGLKLSNCNMVD